MIIHEGYNNLKFNAPCVTIGVFDGVHLGHKALLDRLVASSREKGADSVVITFNPHPKLVLGAGNENISYLSTLKEKIFLLEKSQIDHLVIINFTKEFAEMEAGEFVREILVNKTGVRHLILGYDNHFGKSKGGNFSGMNEFTAMYGFTTEQVKGVEGPGGIISSTGIREALLAGKLECAGKCLGYNYSLSGMVVEGKKLGRALGFPTANIQPDDPFKLIPYDGVYAVEVVAGNAIYKGVLSIGFNPTISLERTIRSIEVNIFDFHDNLYGETVTVFFRYRLRDEKKFDTTGQLTKQMEADREEAIRLLYKY